MLGERTFRFGTFLEAEARAEIREHALQACRVSLDAALACNCSADLGLLTFVMNFITPQASAAAVLDQAGGEADLTILLAELNRELARAAACRSNVYICDTDAIVGSLGKAHVLDDALYFYGYPGVWKPDDRDYDAAPWHNAPLGGRLDPLPDLNALYGSRLPLFCDAIWRSWDALWRTVNRADAVKLVVFDLDDTLWRGTGRTLWRCLQSPSSMDGLPRCGRPYII